MDHAMKAPPACSLDACGVRAQGERYREIGVGARIVKRSSRRLAVAVRDDVDPVLVQQAIGVERECCPFFAIDWQPRERRLSFAVEDEADGPALAAVAAALGLEDTQP